ncbi:hypothetical protein MTR67_017389 [Solanum verrucosum]|uniref:Uncharacterized protein n=1 Tax=Solanum verrucosum TaxID=315347 RepID=A0AAF0QQ67_SOLVR|nr:hypothetical protein MTR67_017389 [Solanum verrucosum]
MDGGMGLHSYIAQVDLERKNVIHELNRAKTQVPQISILHVVDPAEHSRVSADQDSSDEPSKGPHTVKLVMVLGPVATGFEASFHGRHHGPSSGPRSVKGPVVWHLGLVQALNIRITIRLILDSTSAASVVSPHILRLAVKGKTTHEAGRDVVRGFKGPFQATGPGSQLPRRLVDPQTAREGLHLRFASVKSYLNLSEQNNRKIGEARQGSMIMKGTMVRRPARGSHLSNGGEPRRPSRAVDHLTSYGKARRGKAELSRLLYQNTGPSTGRGLVDRLWWHP